MRESCLLRKNQFSRCSVLGSKKTSDKIQGETGVLPGGVGGTLYTLTGSLTVTTGFRT